MKVGDVIRLKRANCFLSDGRSSCEFVPLRKDEVFVCAYLGVEPLKQPPADFPLEAIMRSLGWVPVGMATKQKLDKQLAKLKAALKKRSK